jgi:hypothetical protein
MAFTIAEGLRKSIIASRETTFATIALPGATSFVVRRVTGNFNLKKDTYKSNEIRTDHQMVDFRHGVRSVEGNIAGELSPGTYADFMAAAIGQEFAAVVTTGLTSLTLTIAGTGPTYTVSQASGSFLTTALRVGQVVRLTGAGFTGTAANINLLIVSVSALALGVVVLNGSALTAQASVASAAITIPGMTTFIPTTTFTYISYTVEELFADIAQSEVCIGNKINTMDIKLPASGLATIDFAFMGIDNPVFGTTAYFTSPVAQGAERITASVNGALLVAGVPVALVTSLDIKLNKQLSSDAVVGSNTKPYIFEGISMVDGSMTVLYINSIFPQYFANETEVSLVVALTTTNLATADFITFTMPRIKLNQDTKDDGEKAISSQMTFQALKHINTVPGGEVTTLQIHDSGALGL